MSKMNPKARAEAHKNWLKPKSYYIVLNEVLPFRTSEVKAALEKLGYKMISTDRYGRAYCHHNDPSNKVEVNEADNVTKYVRLLLSKTDVPPSDIARTEYGVESLYDRLYSICKAQQRETSD